MKNRVMTDPASMKRIYLMPSITNALQISGDGYTTVVNTLDRLRTTTADRYWVNSPLWVELRYVAALFGKDVKLVAAAVMAVSGTTFWSLDEMEEALQDCDSQPSIAQLNETYALVRDGLSYAAAARQTNVSEGNCVRIERLFGFHQKVADDTMDAAYRAVRDGLSVPEAMKREPLLGRFKRYNASSWMRKARKNLAEMEEVFKDGGVK